MKTTLFIITLLSFTSLNVSAQDDRKLRRDATYSVHNYKHPNKAATARSWSTQAGVTVNAPSVQTTRIANYKQPVPGQEPTASLLLPHTPLQSVALRNYKIQGGHSVRPKAQTVSGEPADRPQTQSSTAGN